MTSFLELLRENRIAIDTMIFIYAFENHPLYSSFLRSLFSRIEKGEMDAMTNTVTITECLVQPYRMKNFVLAAQYLAIFRNFPHLSVVPVTDEIVERAAFLRATHNIKIPDAIQVVTALMGDAKFFLTNDESLTSIKDISIFILDRITEP